MSYRRWAHTLRMPPTPRLRWHVRAWRAVRYWATRQWDVGRARVQDILQRVGKWLDEVYA